ncbi:fatty acyl-CoA hydrolase precursor, medium chain-like isoform X1 [Ahaetulla prasina]|uniref:fatty acyl-CoA hydrolase precursor, medium chain-like isoform X1 n=2 Tax=Ahaetulla prasina TaxID=499056 RepID=UPI002648D73E|nr:fatty acyl-CoA hydrolase precursor, medium chain-like isoform X1 [Ahaetulla prasina]
MKCWLFGIVIESLLVARITTEGERQDHLEVITKYGRLRGKLADVEGMDEPVKSFLGIPFAKPPTGSLRFSPPQPAEPWSHVRDATSHPPLCLQDLGWLDALKEIMNITLPNLTVSEDCLYLNIFTPDMEAKLPVMVWLHGGGLVIGGASLYDGSALSAYGNVVVVVVQYRLGILGFLSTGSQEAPGNWGLLDQVAALQWVQENIEAFGGDPSCVTIFGESAGGFSVGAQILSPLSKGLFHRAISESGTVQLPGFFIQRPEVLAQKVASAANCETTSPAMLLCLRNKTEGELNSLISRLLPELHLIPAVVDGEFILKAPEELLVSQELHAIPYLIGVNNNEYGWLLYGSSLVKNSSDLVEGMDRERIAAELQPSWNYPPEIMQMILDKYLEATEDPIEFRSQFQKMMEDAIFVIPSLQTARNHRDSAAPVYFYEFQHRPTAFKDTKPDFVKADHGDELGFVFGGPFLRSNSIKLSEATEDEKQLSRTIMKYWSNFARNGNPNGEGLVEWPSYGLHEEYLELNLEQRKSEKLRNSYVDFWLKVLPEKMKMIIEEEKTHPEL